MSKNSSNEAKTSAVPRSEMETHPSLNANSGGIALVGINGLLADMAAKGDIAIETTTEPMFTNYRVQYIAPTKPEHTFESVCYIVAHDAEFNSDVRVFDVPDACESQRAAAEFACLAMNTHDPLVATLELARETLYKMPALSMREIILRAQVNAQINMVLDLVSVK